MNHEQCQRYLEKIQNLGIKFGLENVRTILSYLDNPQEKYPSVVVGGTNGKGSVCAMLASILSRHGCIVGLYTSPHLVKVEERVRVGMNPIPEKEFCQELTLLREAIEELISQKKLISPPTYFEMLTCLALLYFARQKVDMAVLEVGMGGRFDATNVVVPVVSVITTVSREHQRFLGNTIRSIAFEKAGIIKPGVSVFYGAKKGQAHKMIRERARDEKAPFYGVFDRKDCFEEKRIGGKHSFLYRSDLETYSFTPSLPGRHQGQNAAVAIVVAEFLSKSWRRLEKDKIIKALEETEWEGRLETLSEKPRVILDGAHNEEGARALRSFAQEFIHSPVTLVVAFKRDKEIRRLVKILFPMARKIVVTRFPYFRAAEPEEIRTQSSGFQDRIVLEPDVKRAVELALSEAGREGCVLITGSLYLAGEVKKIFPSVIRSKK